MPRVGEEKVVKARSANRGSRPSLQRRLRELALWLHYYRHVKEPPLHIDPAILESKFASIMKQIRADYPEVERALARALATLLETLGVRVAGSERGESLTRHNVARAMRKKRIVEQYLRLCHSHPELLDPSKSRQPLKWASYKIAEILKEKDPKAVQLVLTRALRGDFKKLERIKKRHDHT